MDTSTLRQVHQLRAEWVSVKFQYNLTRQQISELEDQLKGARERKSSLQARLTELEVREKETLNQVQYVGNAAKSAKLKVTKAVSNSLKEAFKALSDTEREALVASFLDELQLKGE